MEFMELNANSLPECIKNAIKIELVHQVKVPGEDPPDPLTELQAKPRMSLIPRNAPPYT